LLPAADDGLQLIAFGSSARIATWEVDAIAPETHTNLSRPLAAFYNADGSRVAVHTAVREGTMAIDGPAGGSPIYLQPDISSGAWHSTDPALFAWTVAVESGPNEWTGYLAVADVTGYAATGLEPLVEFPLPEGRHSLLAWGNWGFVIADEGSGFRPITKTDLDLLDPQELDGVFFDATDDGTLLMARMVDGAYVPYLVAPDGSEIDLVGLDIGASDFRITSNGEWVIALTPQADGHTSLLARAVHSRSTRLSSIEGAGRFVSFVLDDQFVALQEDDSGDLVFKDWNTGAEFRLPIASRELIADVFL
jgi:hypothetical protein